MLLGMYRRHSIEPFSRSDTLVAVFGCIGLNHDIDGREPVGRSQAQMRRSKKIPPQTRRRSVRRALE
jgi:hypothetical protein